MQDMENPPIVSRGSCPSSSRMVDWSKLPYDLIVSVANKLIDVVDFLAFSAVCRSWQLVYRNKSWFQNHRIPWLMITECLVDDVNKREFFSLVQLKLYKFPQLEAKDRCWGSSHGWIMIVNEDLRFCLVNPLTRACLQLPKHPILRRESDAKVFGPINNGLILKVRDELVTMVIHSEHSCLTFAKPGDSDWTDVPISSPIAVVNIVCFKDEVLAVTMDGSVVRIDMEGRDGPQVLHIASPPREKDWERAYLVESSGNLLLVMQYGYLTELNFKIYKFDILNKQWIALEDLGNNMLLVDGYRCVSVSAFGFLKPNFIFFIEDSLASSLYPPEIQRPILMMCNFKEGNTKISPLDVSSTFDYANPVWTTISLW